jgi:Ca2+-binding RTX toxin-like protein
MSLKLIPFLQAFRGGIPNSMQRVALVSLAWNEIDPPLKKNSLLGNGLLTAIENGDFAEAWFQIRYNSNGGGTATGVAKRRYLESQIFGLYNETGGAAIPNTEALQTYAMLSASTPNVGNNRNAIFTYEQKYSAQVQKADSDYSSSGTLAQTLEQALQPAATTLLNTYVLSGSLDPYANQGLYSVSSISPLDIQVANSGGNEALVSSFRSGYNLGAGYSPQPSMLIAQDGADTLTATGSSNDVLIGGTGNDVINAGSGDYIVAGTGNDSITLSTGSDTVVLGESDLADSNDTLYAGQDTIYAQQDSSAIDYYVATGTQETINLGTNKSSNIYLVSHSTGAVTQLQLNGTWVANNEWVDTATQSVIIQSTSDGKTTLSILSADAGASQNASQDMARVQLIAGADDTDSDSVDDKQPNSDVSVATTTEVSAAQISGESDQIGTSSAQGDADITLYGFTGTSEDGITLGSAPTLNTPSIQPANITELDRGAPGHNGVIFTNEYSDDGDNGSQLLGSIYGANTEGATYQGGTYLDGYGDYIDGYGNAQFIYANDGNNTVSADNLIYDSSIGGYDNGSNANLTIEGGSGDQTLIAGESGYDTIIGGNLGDDTAAQVDIWGEEATDSISVGSEDAFVFGGDGANTIDGGSADELNSQGSTVADVVVFAGLLAADFNDTEPDVGTVSRATDSYQLAINGTAYFGSSLDPGDAGSSTLPGSLIIGGDGNEILAGNVGNDTIIGGNETNVAAYSASSMNNDNVFFDDVLVGGAGNNLLVAGDGTDALYADMTPDVSNWDNLGSSYSNTIYGGSGFDIVYGSGGSNYIYGSTGYLIAYVGNGQSSVYAGSGTTLVVGGSGGDYIEGGSGSDSLEGGSGADTIVGGVGGTGGIWGMGGNDYLDGGGGNYQIFANIDPVDNPDWASAGGSDSVTIDAGGGDALIYGSGGSNLIYANSGNDTIYLGNGSTTLDAGSGASDIFIAGGGDETYMFADNSEQDYISSAGSASSITLDITGFDASDLLFTEDQSGDLIISFGSSQIDVLNYSAGANLTIAFDDGSTLDTSGINYALQQPSGDAELGVDGSPDTIDDTEGYDSIGNLSGDNVVIGGDGYTTIYGGTGSDTIEAGVGGASIIGGAGTETYVFNIGDGSSTIDENHTTAGTDAFLFGSNVNEWDISFTQQGLNLVMLVDGGSNGEIEIANYFAPVTGSSHSVGSIEFADGTTMSQADVSAALVYMDNGGPGITGAAGSNVYQFNNFSGTNTITQSNSDSTNTINFTNGLLSSDFIARRDMTNDLVLTDTLDGVTVTVDNYFIADNGGIDNNFTINFSDGTSWNSQQILTATMTPSGGPDTLWGSNGNDSITAGAGDTLIIATTGNNTLIGGAGTDTIDGGSGADTIEGGSGTTQINGGTGSETYVYNFGDGSSTITESTLSGGQDSFSFGAGVTESDLKLSQVGDELIMDITDPNTGVQQSMIVTNYIGENPSSNHIIGGATFADGTTLTAEQFADLISSYTAGPGGGYLTGGGTNATYYAGVGAEVTVQGGPGNDLIYGGSGSDTLYGGTGNNTIVSGTGGDLIQGSSGNDSIELGNGDATVLTSDGNDTYTWSGTGAQVIEGYGYYYNSLTGEINYNNVQGSGYATNPDNGSDSKTGQDVIQIGGGVTANELTFQLATDGSTGVVIGVVGTGGTLELDDISTQDVDGMYGIAGISLSDGETISASQIVADAVAGSEQLSNTPIALTAGADFAAQGTNDTIYADDGNDTIVATPGAQVINVIGNNTIVFGRGSGSDTVYGLNSVDSYNLSGQLVVQFAAGVRPQDIQVVTEPDSYDDYPVFYSVQIKGTQDQLNIAASANNPAYGSENVVFQFADGTTWTAAQMQAYSSQSLNDGTVVSFDYGDGQETISGNYNSNGPYTVQMGVDVDPSQVTVSADSNGDYIFSLEGTSDQLMANSGNLSGVVFGNGTVWQAAQLAQLVMQAQPWGNQYIPDYTNGNDVLTAEGSGDTLVGGTGNDTLVGDNGADTLIGGSGNDSLEAGGGTALLEAGSGNDTLVGGSGTDTLYGGNGNDVLEAGSGTTLAIAEGGSTTLIGGSGNSTLQGGSGNSTFVAGSGDASMVGGAGTNVFQYGLGDGNDTIELSGSSVIQLGAGITQSDISFSVGPTGQDLILHILGTNQTLDLQGWLSSGSTGTSRFNVSGMPPIEFADGTSLGMSRPTSSDITDMVGGTVLIGDTGSDTITSTDGNDVIFAGSGNDSINAGAGNDTIYANDGSSANVTINGGQGNDIVLGGSGYVGEGSITFEMSDNSGQNFLNTNDDVSIQFAAGITASQIETQVVWDPSVGQYDTEVAIEGTNAVTYIGSSEVTLMYSSGASSSYYDYDGYNTSSNGASSSTYTPGIVYNYIDDFNTNGFTLNFDKDKFGNVISAANMTVTQEGDNVVFIEGSTIYTLMGFYQTEQNASGQYVYVANNNVTVDFADGTVWNSADIEQKVAASSSAQSEAGQTFTYNGSNQQNYLQVPNPGGDTVVSEGSNNVLDVVSQSGFLNNDTIDWDGGTNNETNVSWWNNTNTIDFASGITPNNLIALATPSLNQEEATGDNLEIYDVATGNLLVIQGFFFNQDTSPNGATGGTFQFADGSTITTAQLMALTSSQNLNNWTPLYTVSPSSLAANAAPGPGSENPDQTYSPVFDVSEPIVVAPGAQTVTTGNRNNDIYAGSGPDTFEFGHGSGNDTINGTAASGVVNTLQFTADVDPSDVAVYATGANGTLVLELIDSGQTVTLPDYLAEDENQVIQQVTFANGTVWSAATLENMAEQPSQYNQYMQASTQHSSIIAGSGDDTLVSSNGADTLTAGSGADTLYGGSGTDVMVGGSGQASMIGGSGNETYQFAPGFGRDTILFDAAQSNTIRFTDGIVASDVSVSEFGQDLDISVQGGGTIVLSNALVWGGLSDMIIEYADGTSTSLSTLIQSLPEYRVASPGSESITGDGNNDTLVADSGNDTLVAGSGNDTLVAGSGNDVLVAGTGNDLVVGGAGAFTFQVGATAGENTINAQAPVSGTNVLQFTTDVADLIFTQPVMPSTTVTQGVELYIDVNDANGWASGVSLINDYQNGTPTGDIGEIQFSDGSQVSMSQIEQWLSAAGPNASVEVLGDDAMALNVAATTGVVLLGGGDDTVRMNDGNPVTLVGGSGNDDYISGSGSDSIVADSSSNTFEYESFFGQDSISANWNSANNVISLDGAGASDVLMTVHGNDLVISTPNIDNGEDGQPSSLTLTNYFANGVPTGNASEIVLDDGSTISLAQIDQALAASPLVTGTTIQLVSYGVLITLPGDGADTLIGNSSAETLTGSANSDMLEAGTGNELLSGGTGSENYVFGSGFGQDTVVANGSAASNTITFVNATASQVSFSTNGSNLLMTVAGSTGADGETSTITLPNHYANGQPVTDVGAIVFSDGTTVSMSQINQLLVQSGGAPVHYEDGTVLTASGSGDDTLTSNSGDDTLVGGGGSTTMIGGSGTDLMMSGQGYNDMQGGTGAETYEIASGANANYAPTLDGGQGQTLITPDATENGANTLLFTGDITPTDLAFEKRGTSLEIGVSDGSSQELVEVANYFLEQMVSRRAISRASRLPMAIPCRSRQ